MRFRTAHLVGLLVLSLGTSALIRLAVGHAENIGTVSQPLVAGTVVSAQEQQEQALVGVRTTDGRCSGTLLNSEWVISAAHCFSKSQPASTIQIIAYWPTRQTRVGSYLYDVGKDIAIVRLAKPFDNISPNYNLRVYTGAISTGRSVKIYGQGVYALATGSGASAMPSKIDKNFRTADFTVTHVDDDHFWFSPTKSGAIPAGGDSGGPAFITAGGQVYLAGVSSACEVYYMDGKSNDDWDWVTKIDECGYAPLAAVWPAIEKHIGRPECRAYAWGALGALDLARTTYHCEAAALQGARYSPNFDDHLKYCMSVPAAQRVAEERARNGEIQQCRIAAAMPHGNARLMVAEAGDGFQLSGGGYAVNTRVIIRATDSFGVQKNITSNFSDAKGTFSAVVSGATVCSRPGTVTFTAEDQDNKPSAPVTSSCKAGAAPVAPPADDPAGGRPGPPGGGQDNPPGLATATDDVDIYAGPDGDTTMLGMWRKGSQATPLESRDGWCKLRGIARGRDAWVWGEFVSGCVAP